ncbi:UNVERIFIED_CONTAM: Copia protein [Sesamum indicum]
MIHLSKSETPQQNEGASFEPIVPTDGAPALHRSIRKSQPPDRYGFLELTSQLDNDPRMYGEAMSDINLDKWLKTIKSEMDSIGSNQVWTLVDPKGVKPVGLMAKGYTQRLVVDFEETYSPIDMGKSIRILLAIAAWYDYEIWQMGVKIAFLNSFIRKRSTCISRMVSLPLEKNRRFIVSKSPSMASNELPEARTHILMRDRSSRMLGLTQSSYIKKILKRFKMENSKEGFHPMRYGIKISKKQSPKTDQELKKDTVADFTTEAEYISASEATMAAVWMKNYIQELSVVPNIAEPVVIFCDNNGTIAQAKEPRSHHQSKHILRRHHLLREMVSRADVKMDGVSSTENRGDPLTKSMSEIAPA